MERTTRRDPGMVQIAKVLLVAWATLLLGSVGCNRAVYRTDKLPAELSVGRAESTRSIDLSRLSRSNMQSDVIYPGDVLKITVATGMEERVPNSWPLRVAETGEVDIPLVGLIRVSGLTLTDAEQAIRHECIARRIYVDPNVSVLLENRKTIHVTVVGAVNSPGTTELPAANADLLSALLAAGGLKESASTIVEIRRSPERGSQFASYGNQRQTVMQNDSIRVDLIAASEGMTPEYRIEDGSVIMVREQDPKMIQVIGLVKKADQFEVPAGQDVRLLDAIALAGGLTISIADKVTVVRQLDDMTDPVVISGSIKKAKKGGSANIRLAPGDVVSVEETPLTFTVGTIRDFVRFGFNSAVPGI